MDGTDLKSSYLDIKGTRIHYLEQGTGDPVILLHGVPTSGWVWRKVIPHLSPLSRCIAPDLAGFGQSGKPDLPYTLGDQLYFLDELINTLHLNRITFVLHGWGGILGLTSAMQNENRCKALVFYETWMHPVTDEHLSIPYQELLQSVLQEKNIPDITTNGLRFVDQILRQTALIPFSEKAMAHYCAPFSHSGAGKALAQYLAEAPRGDGKSTADKLLLAACKKLQKSQLPKLLLYSVPGFLMTMATIEWAKKNLSSLEVIETGEELHYAQENQPDLMGETISAWLQGVEQMPRPKKKTAEKS